MCEGGAGCGEKEHRGGGPGNDLRLAGGGENEETPYF